MRDLLDRSCGLASYDDFTGGPSSLALLGMTPPDPVISESSASSLFPQARRDGSAQSGHQNFTENDTYGIPGNTMSFPGAFQNARSVDSFSPKKRRPYEMRTFASWFGIT